jgi:hypothetical protein
LTRPLWPPGLGAARAGATASAWVLGFVAVDLAILCAVWAIERQPGYHPEANGLRRLPWLLVGALYVAGLLLRRRVLARPGLGPALLVAGVTMAALGAIGILAMERLLSDTSFYFTVDEAGYSHDPPTWKQLVARSRPLPEHLAWASPALLLAAAAVRSTARSAAFGLAAFLPLNLLVQSALQAYERMAEVNVFPGPQQFLLASAAALPLAALAALRVHRGAAPPPTPAE